MSYTTGTGLNRIDLVSNSSNYATSNYISLSNYYSVSNYDYSTSNYITSNFYSISNYDYSISNFYSTSNFFTSNNYIGSQWSDLANTIYTIDSNVGIGTSSALYTLDCLSNDGIRIPCGTTAERPINSNDGLIRYNTSTSNYEGYSNLTWGTLGGSSGGGGPATDLQTSTTVVNISGSAAPLSNQSLVALDGSNAVWSYPIAYITTYNINMSMSNIRNSNIGRVGLSGDITNIGGGTTIIPYNSITFDSNNLYLTNKFTPKIDGYYMFNHQTTYTLLASGALGRCELYKNNVTGLSVSYKVTGTNTADNITVFNQDIIYLTTSDYIQTFASVTGNTTTSIVGDPAATSLNVILLNANTISNPTISLSTIFNTNNVYNPYFTRYYKSSGSALTGGTDTKIVFDTKSLDLINTYTSGTFTVGFTGYYILNASIYISSSTTCYGYLVVKINGTNTYYSYQQATVGFVCSYSFNRIVYLTVGDTFEFWINANGTGNSVNGNVNTTWMNSYLISPSSRTPSPNNITYPTQLQTQNLYITSVYLSTDQLNFTDNTWTTVGLDTITFDLNNSFDTSTNTYTAKDSGYYNVSAGVTTLSGNITAGKQYGISLYKNGTTRISTRWTVINFSNPETLMITDTIFLYQNDTIQLQFISQSGNNTADIAGGISTYLGINMISRNPTPSGDITYGVAYPTPPNYYT
jgi:hypothetical protein